MREIELSRGLVALVDDDMHEYLAQWRWCAVPASSNGYYAVRYERLPDGRGRRVYMHREILGLPRGYPDMQTDHVNGDKLDNRRENLRVATRAQNAANRGLFSNNKSGYKGVSWNRSKKRWIAKIRKGPDQIHLGTFTDPVEAALAYDQAARKLQGQYAYQNFSDALSEARESPVRASAPVGRG